MVSNSIPYLGVFINVKLTWKDHINYIVAKALVAVNAFRALAMVSWRANPEILLRVYKGLIRAHLEWGAVLYAGATLNFLKGLDRVQYKALRTALGCMKTTPIPILLAEAKEPPRGGRRKWIIEKYTIRILLWRDNPIAPRIRGLKERIQGIKCCLKYLKRFRTNESY